MLFHHVFYIALKIGLAKIGILFEPVLRNSSIFIIIAHQLTIKLS